MPQPVSVVCVNVGNYLGRGAEYVNKLYKAVRRNTTTPFFFHCLTDNPDGLIVGIRPIPPRYPLKGWWNKMQLFKFETLPWGRVVYLDLDTVLLGPIDKLLQYSGPFAMLDDFMGRGYGSGVMAWDNRKETELWNAYVRAGKPQIDDDGDQAFIASHLPGPPDLLQNHVDGIYSYKVHCAEKLPGDARIVCFHGQPRPHMVEADWLKKHWA